MTAVEARTPDSRTLVSVQHLRAAAAIAVVVFHVARGAGLGDAWPMNIGALGVDLFFVISGLIMWITTFGRVVTPQAFLMRRARRIVPLYWALSVVAVLLAIAVPSFAGPFTGLQHTLSSFAFIAATNPITGTIDPVILPGWTLDYEMLFYLVFAAFLTFGTKIRFAGPILMLLGLAALTVVPVESAIVGFYTQNIVLEFALGLALGAIYTAGRTLSPAIAVACIAAGALGLLSTEWVEAPRALAAGVPCALIVAGAALSDRRRAWPTLRLPLLLGDASYSIYLAHPFVVSALLMASRHMDIPRLAFVTIGIPLSIATGLVVYRGVEQPLARLTRRRPPALVAIEDREAVPVGP